MRTVVEIPLLSEDQVRNIWLIRVGPGLFSRIKDSVEVHMVLLPRFLV